MNYTHVNSCINIALMDVKWLALMMVNEPFDVTLLQS